MPQVIVRKIIADGFADKIHDLAIRVGELDPDKINFLDKRTRIKTELLMLAR